MVKWPLNYMIHTVSQLDLTGDILKKKQISINNEEFDVCMKAQKENARQGWKGVHDNSKQKLWFDIAQNNKATEFLGYDHQEVKGAKLIATIDMDMNLIDCASDELCPAINNSKNNEHDKNTDISDVDDYSFVLVFDKTPFYAESGGQVGDKGVIIQNDEMVASVVDTVKGADGQLILHKCKLKPNKILQKDQKYTLQINQIMRNKIKANHSATHLLHSALKKVLDENYVQQKGSVVNDEKLRFDFSWDEKLTASQIEEVELLVNSNILSNAKVNTTLMSKERRY